MNPRSPTPGRATDGEKVVVVGDSAIAEVAFEYLTHDSPHQVVAFAVERQFIKKEHLFELPVVPFEDVAQSFAPGKHSMFVAVGYNKLNRVRARLYEEGKRKGFGFISYVSSRAFVWRNVEIGENCFIFEGNVIQPFVRIGNNVTIWSGNHIGHHSVIRDHCFISSHVVVSGFDEIGESCFLGVNATLANNVVVAKDCLVGAGAVILRNTEEGRIYGVTETPAKEVGALRFFGIKE